MFPTSLRLNIINIQIEIWEYKIEWKFFFEKLGRSQWVS